MKETQPCKFFHHCRYQIAEKDHGPTNKYPVNINQATRVERKHASGRKTGVKKNILLNQNEVPRPHSSWG